MTDASTEPQPSPPPAEEVPDFPVPTPPVFAQAPEPVLALIHPVLAELAGVVAGSTATPGTAPTPCADFDVATLRDHVLGWLQFFAAALADPDRKTVRMRPEEYRSEAETRDLAEVVRSAAAGIEQAVRDGVQTRGVVMSQARMTGPSVLGMLLGEYVVHGWDLARATGQPWQPPAAAAAASLEFFQGMIAPEYRGGDGGYFAEEVAVPADAPALERLVGFAGRDPAWQPA